VDAISALLENGRPLPGKKQTGGSSKKRKESRSE
jgi:hypothetical protein